MSKIYTAIPEDLILAQKLAYEGMGMRVKNFVQESESQDYGACTFEINNKIAKFRVAKITPTKIGQFVTLWKRIGSGPIMPYDISDSIDLFIISVRKGEKIGQFVFPKDVLRDQGFVSKAGKGGKRAMRIYPPWDRAENDQAKKTQLWQLSYFFEIQPNLEMFNVKKLFC